MDPINIGKMSGRGCILFLVLLSIPQWVFGFPDQNGLVVGKQGSIKGTKKTVTNNKHEAPEPLVRFDSNQPNFEHGLFHADNPATTCEGTLDASYPNFPGSEMWNPTNTMGEDCLQLNVWVPADIKLREKNQKLPVLVWIYGGGFFSGSPSLDVYKGEALAAVNSVIVVNVNYRVGPFGFLYLGTNTPVSGNMGLLDQQEALKWIQNNIEAFGGDKNKVTLFGESAGAASVSAHLLAPESRPLFASAILQSGAMTNRWAMAQPDVLYNRSRNLLKELDCWKENLDSSLECARSLDPKAVTNSGWGGLKPMQFPFVPVAKDGKFFTTSVQSMILNGDFKNCPIIIGTVLDEGTFWLPYTFYDKTQFPGIFDFDPAIPKDQQTDPLSEPNYKLAMTHAFLPYDSGLWTTGKNRNGNVKYDNKTLQSILLQYSKTDKLYADKERVPQKDRDYIRRDGVALAFHDFFFSCDVLQFARLFAAAGNPTYVFFFTQRSSVNPWPLWEGVMHGYEIEYFFGAPLTNDGYSDQEAVFSRRVMKYWTEFARTGKPTDDSKDWPPYVSRTKQMIVLNSEYKNVRGLTDDNCRFWEGINEKQ